MKESITIHHFGPLKHIDIHEIKPMTVIIGPSSSGKSTLMKVIIMMRYIYKMVNIRAYLKNANITRSPFRFRFDSLLHDGLENMASADTVIIYTVEINGHAYTITYKDRKLFTDPAVPNADLVFFKESFISETRSVIPSWASSTSRTGNIGYFFHETYKDFNEATDVVKKQVLNYLNLKLTVQKTGNKPKRFTVEEAGGRAFDLRYASSGVQTSAPLLTIVRYFAHEFSFKDAFQRSVLSYLFEQNLIDKFKPEINQNDLEKFVHIHIEEPELSLDPDAQCALINEIIREALHRKSDDRQLGLMLATHSPYITNYLNVLLRASYFGKAREKHPFILPSQVVVYRLADGELTSLMATDNDSNETVINTIDLSDTMDRIFNAYETMGD